MNGCRSLDLPRTPTLRRRQPPFLTELKRCPAHVILPCEKQVSGRPELCFVMIPDVFRDLDNGRLAVVGTECVHNPWPQGLLLVVARHEARKAASLSALPARGRAVGPMRLCTQPGEPMFDSTSTHGHQSGVPEVSYGDLDDQPSVIF